jgi:hypothetical protein
MNKLGWRWPKENPLTTPSWGEGGLRLKEVVKHVLSRASTLLLTSTLWYLDAVLPISSIW